VAAAILLFWAKTFNLHSSKECIFLKVNRNHAVADDAEHGAL
jgi:hypothetical protein